MSPFVVFHPPSSSLSHHFHTPSPASRLFSPRHPSPSIVAGLSPSPLLYRPPPPPFLLSPPPLPAPRPVACLAALQPPARDLHINGLLQDTVEHHIRHSPEAPDSDSKLTVGIVGFGNFGQFLAKRIVEQGHTVIAHSRSDYGDIAREIGVSYFRDPDDFCEEHPEVILLCTSIVSTKSVLESLPLHRLRRNTLFVDVLSVKEFPRNLFLQMLPSEFDILCTHPMFGPQSGKASWAGLPFVYDKVRIGGGARSDRCDKFLSIFSYEGCRMVELSCEDHDRYAAESQFITHTFGRVLGTLGLESTPINTKGYEQLLQLVKNTNSDSFELYYGLFMYNVNATEQLERLELAFDSVKKQLFGQLHEILRKQLQDGVEAKINGRAAMSVQKFLPSRSNLELTTVGVNLSPTARSSHH